jgi:hypothetical protein
MLSGLHLIDTPQCNKQSPAWPVIIYFFVVLLAPHTAFAKILPLRLAGMLALHTCVNDMEGERPREPKKERGNKRYELC